MTPGWHSAILSVIMSDSKEKTATIRPLAKLVLARIDEAPDTTPSGLYLPKDAASEDQKTATVTAVGPEVKEIKAGDRIIYEEYSGTKVKYLEEAYILVPSDKILAIIA